MVDNKKIRITEADFLTGIFAVLTLRGHKTIPLNEFFEKAMAKIFQEFTEHAKQNDFEMRFRIRPHPLHGDSGTIHNGVLGAMQRRIISLDSPANDVIRIKLTKDLAKVILDDMTSGKLFIDFSDRIIEIFRIN